MFPVYRATSPHFKPGPSRHRSGVYALDVRSGGGVFSDPQEHAAPDGRPSTLFAVQSKASSSRPSSPRASLGRPTNGGTIP